MYAHPPSMTLSKKSYVRKEFTMKKKILAMLLALVMVISLLPVSVFATEAEGEHDHAHCPGEEGLHTLTNCEWEKGETVDPICGQWGYTLYECEECGADFAADFVKPVGKCDYEVVEGKAATCTEPGKEPTWTCKICGTVDAVNNGEEIEALGHDFKVVEDCSEKAICSRCGEEGESGKHAYTEPPVLIKKPTATENGLVKYTCATCGEEKEVEIVCECTIPELAYLAEYTAIEGKAPTCTKDGVIASKVCKCCGRMYATEAYGEDIEAGDEIESNVIPMGHTWDEGTVTKQPSCTAEGEKVYKCTKCNKGTKTETLKKLEHQYEEEPADAIPAECEKYGFKLYCCTVCGWLESTETVDPLGHKVPFCWEHPTKKDKNCKICARIDTEIECDYEEPTCKEKGTLTYTCPDCEKEVEREFAPLGCDVKTATVEATCNGYAYTIKYCARDNCDKAILTDITAELVEELPEGSTATPKKFTAFFGVDEEGNFVAIEDEERDEINVLEIEVDWAAGVDPDNHTRDNARSKVINAPTCEEDGNEWFYCKYCNFGEIVVLDKIGHDYDYDLEDEQTYRVKTELSCTTDFVITVACGNCGEPKDFVIEETEGHVWNKGTKFAATCYAEAYTLFTCTVCQETKTEVKAGTKVVYDPSSYYESKEKAEAEHMIEGKWVVTRQGSCTVVGLYEAYCSNCEKNIAARIDKTGGHYTDKELHRVSPAAYLNFKKGSEKHEFLAQAPACGVIGWTAQFWCDGCGEFIEAETIDALEHEWDKVEGKDATCTEAGLKDKWTCTICGAVDAENDGSEIEKLNHVYTLVFKSNNCTEFGYIHMTCNNGCGEEFITRYRDKKGHDPIEGEKNKKVGCEEDGWLHEVCSVCGETLKDEVIKAKGHKNKDDDYFWSTCVDTETDRDCTECGEKIGKFHTDAYYEGVLYPATCVDYGYIIYSCELCGLKEVVEIDDGKLGDHNFDYSDEMEEFFEDAEAHSITDAIAIYKAFFEKIGATLPTYHSEGSIPCKNEGCTATESIDALTGLGAKIEVDNAVVAGAEIVDSGKVVVTIKLDGNDVDVWGVNLEMFFDGEVLAFDKAEFVSDKFLNGNANAIVDEYGMGTVAIVASVHNADDKTAQNTTIDGEHALVKLYFDVIYGDIGAMIPLRLEEELTPDTTITSMFIIRKLEAINAKGENVETADEDEMMLAVLAGYFYAEFTVGKYMDVNNDGFVNIADALVVYNMITATEAQYDARADIDKNGVVNASDFIALYKYLTYELSYEDMANGGVKVEAVA